MARRLLDYDHESGVATYHHYDHSNGNTIIESVQNIEPYLENNKQLILNSDKSKQIKNNWWHVACIPIGVQYQWMQKHGVNIWKKEHRKAVFKLLNDPDYKYLKTTNGRIGNGG